MADSRRHASPGARTALVEAVRCDTGPEALRAAVVQSDQPELVELALEQGVAGRAYERLGTLLDEEPGRILRGRARQDSLQHMVHLATLQEVAGTLDAGDIKWLALKGPVLAELSYGSTPRGYSDLDILVHPLQLRDALEALIAEGYSLAERDWPELTRKAKGEVLVVKAGSSMIDLHWHLVSEGRARSHYRVPLDELFERRERVRLATVRAWALEPTDFLAHVALHASFSGAHRLRWLLDIERTSANRPPDWDMLLQRCREWRIALPAGVAMSRARKTLRALVPQEVVDQLADGTVRRGVVRSLSTWVPAGNMPGGRSVRNGIARSLRDGLLSTAGQFVEETVDTLKDLVHPVGSHSAVNGAEAAHRGAEAEAYFQMVTDVDRFGHVR